MNIFYRKFGRQGFTLIELIVVIAVIAIMVTMAVPSYMKNVNEARRVKAANEVKVLEDACDKYYIANQSLPLSRGTQYSADQIKSYSQAAIDKTGKPAELEISGQYYDIDYDELQEFIQKPANPMKYIIMSPENEIFYLEDINESGENRLNKAPLAIITMSPDQNLLTNTNITWSYESSTDPNGDAIVGAEWEGKQDVYSTEGTYVVRLRVQDDRGLWSEWVEKTFSVERPNTKPIAAISMSHDTDLLVSTNITWGYEGSVDPEGDSIINAEWEGKKDVYPVEGVYTVRLRVQDDRGLWSEWTEKTFRVFKETAIKQVAIETNSSYRVFSAAVLYNGTVKIWGANDYGQLGLGHKHSRVTPTTIPGLTNVKQVALGSNFAIALLNDGTVKAWGENSGGKLGLGHEVEKLSPTTIPGLTNVKKIITNKSHSFALLNDGTVKAWGNNHISYYFMSGAMLGLGDTNARLRPTTIPGLNDIVDIVGYSDHTLAITSDGSVWGWGRADSYELGMIETMTKDTFSIWSPKLITDASQVIGGAGGGSSSFILLQNETVKSAGKGSILGHGNADQQKTFKTIEGLADVKSIIAGGGSAAAILKDGSVKVWGSNSYGQLGIGGTTSNNTPVLNSYLNNAKQIAMCDYASIAVMEDGSVSIWGKNYNNFLGLENVSVQTTPTTILVD